MGIWLTLLWCALVCAPQHAAGVCESPTCRGRGQAAAEHAQHLSNRVGRALHSNEVLPQVARYILPLMHTVARDIHFVECFSGCGEASFQLRLAGFRGVEFDKFTRDATEDIVDMTGLIHIALMVLSILPGGLLIAAPVCSSWCMTNRYHSGRDGGDRIMGNEAATGVRDGNLQALHLAWLCILAHSRGVYVMVEQVASSILHLHPAMEEALAMLGATKIHTWMGAFGHAMPKPSSLWVTLPEHVHCYLKKPKPAGLGAPECCHRVTRTGWWTAGPALKGSEAYTPAFGKALADALLQIHSSAGEAAG